MTEVLKNLATHKLGNTRFKAIFKIADEYISAMRAAGKPLKQLRIASKDWEFLESHFIDTNVDLPLAEANYNGLPLVKTAIWCGYSRD